MADNKTFQSDTPATLPAGTIPATKEVAFSGQTTDVQLIEVVAVTGSEGSRTLNEISDASGLKIQDGGNTITVDGTVAVTNAALTELAAAIDTELQVDVVSSALPSGASTSAKQDTEITALQAIQTAVESLDNTVGGNELQVDIVSAPTLTVNAHAVTNAGTFVVQENGTALTHLATIAGDTTDIETAVELLDDTVATLGTTTYSEATTKGLIVGAVRRDADTSLVDTTNEVGPLQMNAAGQLKVEVFSGETLPVSGTLAVTQSGTWDEIGIHDSGNSITVDGTVSVSGTVTVDGSGVTQPISHAALTELAAAIDTEVQVDVVSSALPSGAATSAKQDTIIGHLDGVETLLGTIDADTSTLAGAVSGNEMQVDVLTMPTVAVTQSGAWDEVGINDSGNSITVDNGGTFAVQPTTSPRSQSGPGQPGTAVDSYTHAAINLSAAANQVLVSSAASKQIWVYGIGFTLSVAGTVSFQDEDDTAITGIMPFAALSGMAVPPSGNFSMPIWKLATDKDLEVDLVTADMDGWIDYAIISV